MGLAGCQTTKEPEAKSVAPETGLEARLAPIAFNSGVGAVRFADRGDGFSMLIVLTNLPVGPYRVALHATGNCTSPNGFSAGPPWAPPGAPRAAADLVPVVWINDNTTVNVSVTISGARLRGEHGLQGHSVVVHQGTTVDAEAVPGRPNRRILCGVIGPPQSLFK